MMTKDEALELMELRERYCLEWHYEYNPVTGRCESFATRWDDLDNRPAYRITYLMKKLFEWNAIGEEIHE